MSDQRNDQVREFARAIIAYWLLALLSAVVVATLCIVATGAASLSDIKDVLAILIGPVVSLLGSALGFYYGTQKVDVARRSSE